MTLVHDPSETYGLESEARIYVRPVGGGWSVDCACDETLMFLSGGRAEMQARRLAECLCSLGRDAVVEVHDRSDVIVGAIHFAAGASDEAPPPAA
jgi:hypothetical protein